MGASESEAQQYIDGMYQDRGYVVDFHKIMAAADFEWLKAYNAFAETTYVKQRHLDRKTREMVQAAVLATLRAEVDHIAEHVRQALAHGATSEEVLGALECVAVPMGALGFSQGLKAWAKVAGVQGLEPAPV